MIYEWDDETKGEVGLGLDIFGAIRTGASRGLKKAYSGTKGSDIFRRVFGRKYPQLGQKGKVIAAEVERAIKESEAAAKAKEAREKAERDRHAAEVTASRPDNKFDIFFKTDGAKGVPTWALVGGGALLLALVARR